MSQSTRILLLLGLIVAAVAVWYALFFAGGQNQQAAPTAVTIPRHKPAAGKKTGPVAVTTSARALQVLPIPLLVTEAPEEAPLETNQAGESGAPALASVPPNPFVPLHVEVSKPPEKPKEVPVSEEAVTVTPAADLTANIPVPKTVTPVSSSVAPPPVSLGKGALPIKLSPLTQEVSGVTPLQEAVADNQGQNSQQQEKPQPEPEPTPQASDQQSSEDTGAAQETKPSEPEEPPPPPPNPLAEWATQEQLRLDGIALGPVGVAIFQTASGYLALPVGQTFPDKNVLVKTITAERVLLVDSSGTNTLTLDLGGGE